MQVRSGRGGVHADAGLASEQLKRLTQVLPKARAEIILATEAIIQEAVMAEMKATPIAELKDFGASVGPLQSVGFRTVADLSGRSFGSLLNYRGVGDVTAEAAIKAFGLFQESARAHVRLLPDPDNRRPSDGRLLVALAKYETLVREVSARTEEAQSRYLDTGERLQALRAKTRVRDHLFSLGSQADLARATAQLAVEFRWVSTEARNLSDYAERLTMDIGETWKRYAGNAATFIALLESVLPARGRTRGQAAPFGECT